MPKPIAVGLIFVGLGLGIDIGTVLTSHEHYFASFNLGMFIFAIGIMIMAVYAFWN